MTNDPRFVCIATTEIPHRLSPSVWVRESRTIASGERVLVIFSAGNPSLPEQARLYPLDGPPPNGRKEPIMSVAPRDHVTDRDHIVMEGQGLAVYITPASRRRRVEYQLRLVESRGHRTGDLIDALIDLDHLIFHRCLTGEMDAGAVEADYERVGKLKALALSTEHGGERNTALRRALAIAVRLAHAD